MQFVARTTLCIEILLTLKPNYPMPNSFVINFDSEADLFSFQDKKDKSLRLKAKSIDAQKATKNLLAQDGLLPLPTPLISKAKAKSALKNRIERQGMMNALLNENPVNGLTGALDLGQDAKGKIKQVRIEAQDTSKEEELFEYTFVDIQFREDQTIQDQLPLNGIKVFDAYEKPLQSKSIGPALIPKSVHADTMDTITEVEYLDKNKTVIFTEVLIAENADDIRPDGIYLPLKKLAGEVIEAAVKRTKKGIFRWIRVKIQKFIGVVKRKLNELKGKAAHLIVRGLSKIRRIEKKINERYEILHYDFSKKKFNPLGRHEILSTIDLSKKTLILLHGTIKGSFDGRSKKKHKREGHGSFKYLYAGTDTKIGQHPHFFDYLRRVQKNNAVQYEQIITLEHETVLHDPKMNVEQFRKFLFFDSLKFEQPVAILCASRGSLLAKYICQPSSNIPFEVDKVCIVSGGFSDYFKDKLGAKAYLTNMAKLFGINGPLKFILSLTLDVIVKLPGLDIQNKQSNRFKNIISDPIDTVFYNLVNNYKATNAIWITFERLVADPILGPENDMALGLDGQLDFRPGKIHPSFPPLFGGNVHGKGLRDIENRKAVAKFLGDGLDDFA